MNQTTPTPAVRPDAPDLIEPALQLAWAGATSPGWAQAYVGLHVLAFNLVGLHLFRRYGLLAAARLPHLF